MQDSGSAIASQLWWIIPARLAGVRKPLPDEISALLTAGIGAIVSVMDDPANLELYEQAGLPYCWLPTKGGTAPDVVQIKTLQTFVEQQNQLGQAVAVHCSSGRRRTGTILAAYLILSGLSFEEALQTILAANPAVELREAQINFLKSLADSL